MAAVDAVSLSWHLGWQSSSPVHSKPYPYITRSMVCLLGDAGHPVCFLHHLK